MKYLDNTVITHVETEDGNVLAMKETEHLDQAKHIAFNKIEALELYNAMKRIYISEPEVRHMVVALGNFAGVEV